MNNESSENIRMLSCAFTHLDGVHPYNLYPPSLRRPLDACCQDPVYRIDNGVYRCGFATTRAAYDQAAEAVSAALDQANTMLRRQRYVCGTRLTMADIHLFVTLVRWDEVYVLYFKTN